MAATFKLIYTSAFLLAIIFSHGIISTEERLLMIRTQINKKCDENYLNICENKVGGQTGRNLRRGILDDDHEVGIPGVGNVEASSTDDFRPTEPGHSPGAGHAKGPQSADPNQ